MSESLDIEVLVEIMARAYAGGAIDRYSPPRMRDALKAIASAGYAVVPQVPTGDMREAINNFARSGETDPNETWPVWLSSSPKMTQ